MFAMSTLLDPRFKSLAFSTQRLTQVDKMVVNESLKIESAVQGDENNENNPTIEEKPTSSLWAVFDQAVSKQKKKQNCKKLEIELELKKFKSMPNLERAENPLEWWEKSGKVLFPNLYPTAIKYLVIPATSVPSERIFSTAGSVLTKKRNKLGPKNANIIITLNSNVDLM